MYIDQNLRKALSDRIYDKRKPAASQLEQIVRKAVEQDNTELVAGVINELSRDFAYALRHPNYRNGGSIGLAAVAIASGQDNVHAYLDDIIQPISACFGDADSRVRYYACESLYNVAKIAKGEILAYFNEIFDALCKLTADLEESVRNGANLLDQLMRDIVVETASTYVLEINKEPPQIASTTVEPQGSEGPSFQQWQSTNEQLPGNTNQDSLADQTADSMQQLSLSRPTSVRSVKPEFTLDRFIPSLIERIYVINPATRMFLVQWIMLLDSIPELELIKYVSGFLEGLVLFLTDTHKEVRVYTKTCLDTLLKDIKNVAHSKDYSLMSPDPDQSALDRHGMSGELSADKTQESLSLMSDRKSGVEAGRYLLGQDTYIDYAEIVDISSSKMDPSHNEIRLVVLDWMEGILSVSPRNVFAKLSSLVDISLPSSSDDSLEIRQAGTRLSDTSLDLVPSYSKDVDTYATIMALSRQSDTENKILRLSILQWFRISYSNAVSSESSHEELLVKLLGPLADPSDEVVTRDSELLALILRDSTDEEFESFTKKLVFAFRENEQSFQHRSRFVILQSCILLTPKRVFQTFGGIITYIHNDKIDEITMRKEDEFDRRIIQTMSNILFTAPELRQFRTSLTQLHSEDGAQLFEALFLSWRKNSVAVLSLCLLAKAYQPAYHVLQVLAKYDVTVHNLIQIDKLVQFIEGPVSAPLRMDLLDPARNHFLYKTFYGSLMVSPQSPAFTLSQKRLDSVSSIFKLPEPKHVESYSDSREQDAEQEPSKVKWCNLIQSFTEYRQKQIQ